MQNLNLKVVCTCVSSFHCIVGICTNILFAYMYDLNYFKTSKVIGKISVLWFMVHCTVWSMVHCTAAPTIILDDSTPAHLYPGEGPV